MNYILYNPMSNGNAGDIYAHQVLNKLEDGELINLLNCNKKELVSKLNLEDKIYIVGGDGTLHYFINDLDGLIPNNDIYLFGAGTGNDFLTDIEQKEPFVLINKYLKHLPIATINGKKYFVLNGLGIGLDGYCCTVGSNLRNEEKKVNYKKIAFFGILKHFKPRKVKVIVDGVTYEYDNCWIAPTMNGRFYGGGMMVAPSQDRLNNDTLTNVIIHTKSKIKTLFLLNSIYKGKHVSKKKMVKITKGKCIEVIFDKPTGLQMDGEIMENILEYKIEIE